MFEAIEQVAKIAHEANRAYCETLGDDSQPTWENAPDWQKDSARNGVKFHFAQLAVGVDPPASASHEKWMEQKRAEGWTFGPVKDPAKKEHPCFVEYDQLPLDQRRKDYLFAAICKAFASSAILVIALLTASAVGQNPYQLKNLQGSYNDITSQTATVNAWKYIAGNPVCLPKTLRYAALSNSVWCTGSPYGDVFIFSQADKTWHDHPEFGKPSYVIPLNETMGNTAAVVYALMRTSTCNTMGTVGGESDGWYGVFAWNANTGQWSQPNSGACAAGLWVDYKGTLRAIGWNPNKQITSAYISTNQGASWSLWYDGWKYLNMIKPNEGCVLDLNSAIWELQLDGNGNPSPLQIAPIPSGTAAGCLIVQNPFALMAWNTAGQVFVLIDGASAWQPVTGINLQSAVGSKGYFILGEDSAGKPYHWNVNAPTVSATFGGQWNVGLGCPDEAHPCNSTATHTLSHNMVFKTGHGIGGGLKQATDLFTHDIEVANVVTNPSCDPSLGQQADPECVAEIGATAFCNESNADVQKINYNYVVDDSIDVTIFQLNIDNTGPIRITTGPYSGYYLGTVTNTVIDGCPVADPVPKCPAGPEAFIDVKAEWWGGLDRDAAAYRAEIDQMAANRLGLTDPYVYHSFYLARQLDNGSLMDIHCFPPVPDTPDDFLDGDYDKMPHCK